MEKVGHHLNVHHYYYNCVGKKPSVKTLGECVILGTVVSELMGMFFASLPIRGHCSLSVMLNRLIVFKVITFLESSNDLKVLHIFPFGLQNLN